MRVFSGPVVCPALISRLAEREALSELLERAKGGQGRVVLVCGEAGIGKSRLVGEARGMAEALGFGVLQGNCFQMDSSYPYAPLLDLLRALVGHTLDASEPIIQAFAPLLPELAPFLSDSRVGRLADHEQEKRRLFAALTRFFKERTQQGPVLLIVEDLHWCDDLSLEYLQFLARFCVTQPLLLLLTYRSDEVQSSLQHCVAQLERARLSQELRLAPLMRSDVNKMLDMMFALSQEERTELLDLIYPLSEGNPYFVEEILTVLIGRGELWIEQGVWRRRVMADRRDQHVVVPRSIQDAVQERTQQLSAEAREVLALAAVAGRRFDFEVLQKVMDCDERHLLELIRELLAFQLVVEVSAEEFAFRHMLTQQAVYRGLLARERRLLHRRLAEAIEVLYRAAPAPEAYPADLASHYYQAEVWAKALEYGQRAGARALALYAPAAAIEHLTRALEAVQHLSGSDMSQLNYGRGQAYALLGEFERALSDYEQALAAADGELRWQCLMALGFLWVERDYGRAGEWFRQAFDQASRQAAPILQARSLNRMGNWLGNTGRIEEGLQAHQAALGIFEAQQNMQGMAETFDLLGVMDGMRGDRIRAVEQLGQAIVLFRTLGDVRGLISSLAMRALLSMPGSNETTYCTLRTCAECVKDASESLRLAREIEAAAGQAFAENTLAHTWLAFGEYGQALAHAQEARRIASEIEHQQWIVASAYALGRSYMLLLAPGLALSSLEDGLALARALGSSFWVATLAAHLGRAYILAHNLPAAQATLQAVMPREQLPQANAERDLALVWAELALAQREPGRALQIAEQLLASAPGEKIEQPIPHLLKVKGEALMALGQPDAAIEALEAARQGAVVRNARPVLWTIQRSLGRAYQRRRRNEQAQQAWSRGRQLIEELALTIVDPSLRDQFKHVAMESFPLEQSKRLGTATRQVPGGLTARESEVAVLVAQGKMSREIADLLVISERTAEGHVSNILGKLGFTSRAQIAAWVVERGLGRS